MTRQITPERLQTSFNKLSKRFETYSTSAQVDILRDAVIYQMDLEQTAREVSYNRDDEKEAIHAAHDALNDWFEKHVAEDQFSDEIITKAREELKKLLIQDVNAEFESSNTP